jgi:predicted RNA-binding protein associated with RNAse of E/G family
MEPGERVQVALLKLGVTRIEYPVVVALDDGNHIVVRGPWAEASPRDLGFVVFEPGDVFTEHYWRDRWYSVKEVGDAAGRLKGWYCDVTRPVRVEEGRLISEDLDLDLWVSADGLTIMRLDEEEFVASRLEQTDPDTSVRARRALDELERLARAGFAGVAHAERP